MAESFNLNSFLKSYKHSTYDPTRQHAAAEERMEARMQEKVELAVGKENEFLALTLGEKISELGIGERTVQQVKDTAIGLVVDLVSPIGEYLEKYENIFDQRVYHAEIQSYAKQMFFSSQAMSAQAAENPAGQKFVYDM